VAAGQANQRPSQQLANAVGFALLLCLLAALLMPGQAAALSNDRVTAKPNDSSLSLVIGGEPTRITWVGTVRPDEQVTSLTLVYPKGSRILDSSYVKVTEMIMDDPIHPGRFDPEVEIYLGETQLHIVFKTPIRPNNQIYVEIYDFCLPEGAGSHVFTAKPGDHRATRADPDRLHQPDGGDRQLPG